MRTHKKSIGDAGITLVALVVTIIILLILAGVTINMVLGKNGLIEKSKTAKGKYENAALDEQAQMESASKVMNDLYGDYSTDDTKTNPSTSTGTTVKVGDEVITITAENAKNYYGYKVTNYNKEKDPDGVYRIFYYDAEVKDGKGKYGEANTLYLKRDWTANDVNLSTKISDSSWTDTNKNNAVTMMRKMNPDYASNQTSKTAYSSLENDNERGATWLCDTTQFETYVDSTMANFAIGSPSAEMYCDSYNQVEHNQGSAPGAAKLTASYQSTNVPGYIYQVNGEKQNSGWYTNDDTVDLSGYHGMYLCNQSAKGSYWWWLASPSASNADIVCFVGGSNADLSYGDVSNAFGVCPAVSLKSGVQLEIVNE